MWDFHSCDSFKPCLEKNKQTKTAKKKKQKQKKNKKKKQLNTKY